MNISSAPFRAGGPSQRVLTLAGSWIRPLGPLTVTQRLQHAGAAPGGGVQ